VHQQFQFSLIRPSRNKKNERERARKSESERESKLERECKIVLERTREKKTDRQAGTGRKRSIHTCQFKSSKKNNREIIEFICSIRLGEDKIFFKK
jgi:hypothetical protein